MTKIIRSAIGTKMISRWSNLACSVAMKAVNTVSSEKGGRKEVDIKRYIRIEKVSKKGMMDKDAWLGCVCIIRYQGVQ